MSELGEFVSTNWLSLNPSMIVSTSLYLLYILMQLLFKRHNLYPLYPKGSVAVRNCVRGLTSIRLPDTKL